MFMLAAGGAMAGMSALQSYNASKAKAAAEMTQYNDQMMRQSMSSGVEMYQNSQVNVDRMMANKNIADNAMNSLIANQKNLQTGYEFSTVNMAKQVEANTQSVARRSAAKLGRNSGTYKLANEKMRETGAAAFAQAGQNKYNQEKAMQQQYENQLNQRDLMSYNSTGALIPGLPPVEPNHTAAAVQGGMQGFSQGMGMASSMGSAMSQAVGPGNMPSWLMPPQG